MARYTIFHNKGNRIYFIWFIVMLCSFGYGQPVFILTGMDKLNPRLYDIIFVLGLFIFNNKITRKDSNPIMQIWRKTILWMLVCAIFTMLLVPSTVGVFSLYYWFKYFEGYLVVKMLRLCVIPQNNIRLLEYIFVGVGLFVSFYSLPQYFGVTPIEVDVGNGNTYTVAAGMMVGPYSSTYFALAQIMPICLLFCLNRISKVTRFRILYIAIAALFFFIGASCGSRTSLMLTMGSLLVFFYLQSRTQNFLAATIMVLLSVSIYGLSGTFRDSVNDMIEANHTIERMQALDEDEGSKDSGKSRLNAFKNFNLNMYDYGAVMPIIGSGFYVSPIGGSYRIGYGFHNNYIFAFEQMGLLGLIFFISLLVKELKLSYRVRKENDLGPIMFSFSIILIIASMAGQTFWQGFGTCEMNTLIIYLMALSVEPSLMQKGGVRV